CGDPSSTTSQTGQEPTIDDAIRAGEAEALAAPVAVSAKSLRDRVSLLHLGDDLVTVVVEFSQQPVAVARANALDRQMTADETRSIIEDLRTQHELLRPTIEALGGRVLASYQYVVNGIKVRIPASRMGALGLLPGAVAVKHVATYKIENATSVPFIGAP